MSGIMMQLLGAAGGGANYFFSVIETATDANKRNTIHGIVDSSDNIYVDFDYDDSGTTYMGLVKYNPAGDVLAQRRLTNATYRPGGANELFDGGWSPVFDSSDNYYIVAKATQSNNNPVFLKINSSDLTITSKYEKEFSSGSEYGGFWDSSANFYLCGSTGYAGVGQFAKFNSSGSQQWAKTINVTGVSGGPGAFWTGGGTDSSGNVYVCGTHPAYAYRGIIAKYNSSGTNQWTKWLDEGPFSNGFRTIKCDSSGNPYVVGNMGSTGGKNIAYIAKLNPSTGEIVWDYVHCKVSDPQRGGFQSVDFDSSGNVYAAGIVAEDQYPNGDFYAYNSPAVYVKLNSSGVVQWQRGLSYSSARNYDNRAFATVTIDSKDDMILTVSHSDGSNPVRHCVARLPNDGSLQSSYGSVNLKYGETDLGDRNVGSIGNPSHGNSNTSTNNITSNVADGSNSYSPTTEIA